ncbi:MAG: sugar ABC transporter ATP-binding protein [Planctomycetales bacterium]|nr:sugar ABC transporter ATP-binding protein [Planctomycetales bacterium]
MSETLLACRNVRKQFGSTVVLNDMTVSVPSGTVLGLVGENGAGKSTFLNILGGVLAPDGGEIELQGRRYTPANPIAAARAGVRVVHQELNLFPNLTIAENLFLDELPARWFGIDRARLQREATDMLRRVGLRRDARSLIRDLSPGARQLIEIGRALRTGAKLIVFDEPTTSLTTPESEHLFELIRELRSQGASIIYVSHNLSDVLRLADNVLVLRDGVVQTLDAATNLNESVLIRAMVGREMTQLFPRRQPQPERCEASRPATLELRGLTRRGCIHEVSLRVDAGEIVGLAGLMGSGRTELLKMIYGLDATDAGEVLVDGVPYRRRCPRGWIKRGMAFVTEDRRQDGLLLDSNARDNTLLASWRQYSVGGWLQRRRASQAATQIQDELLLRGDRRVIVRRLSGGNQQKLVFAKWGLRKPRILLLDEPTRGVDVGAKMELYSTICRLADAGTAVLLVSSEQEELIGLCDRLHVMRSGKLVAELQRAEFSNEQILRHALDPEQIA